MYILNAVMGSLVSVTYCLKGSAFMDQLSAVINSLMTPCLHKQAKRHSMGVSRGANPDKNLLFA